MLRGSLRRTIVTHATCILYEVFSLFCIVPLRFIRECRNEEGQLKKKKRKKRKRLRTCQNRSSKRFGPFQVRLTTKVSDTASLARDQQLFLHNVYVRVRLSGLSGNGRNLPSLRRKKRDGWYTKGWLHLVSGNGTNDDSALIAQ